MEAVEKMLTQIQGFSGTNDDLLHLYGLLKQNEDILKEQAQRLPESLSHLDPAKHSLGYLCILETYSFTAISQDQVDGFLSTTSSFIEACSTEQIRIASEKFTLVCKRFKDYARQTQFPARAIIPLQTAIRKLQNSSEQLTPLHADFLLVCLLSKQYKFGLSILEDKIFEVDQAKDFLLYCYYGGTIFIGLKQYEKALEFFQHAITAPATTLSAITVEAYKKFILVSLIHNGQVPPFPKYTSSVVQRSLKPCAQIYVDLVTNYANGDISVIENYINSQMEKFKNDNNIGLAKQVLSSVYKRKIQKLTQTYLTLSLQDIATTAKLQSARQAELHVLQMIQDGEIFATINQKDGMVNFNEDPEQYKTCQMAEHIDSAIQRIVALSKKLKQVDEQISCDHAYLSRVGREHPKFDIDDFDLVPQKYSM